MSTPKKVRFSSDDEDVVVGYVHQVTPLKLSKKNVRYFQAQIQTKEECHKTVVFSPEKHSSFEQAAKNSTPVKLCKITKELNSRGGSGFDVKYTRASTMQVVSKLDFAPNIAGLEEKTTCIEKIKDIPCYQPIKQVTGKITRLDENSEKVDVWGKELQKRDATISDASGSIKVSLWSDHKDAVTLGQSYTFENLTTREYLSKKYLTSSKNTKITVIGDIGSVKEATEDIRDEHRFVKALFTGVSLKLFKICPLCKKNQLSFEETSKYHKCDVCSMRQVSRLYTSAYNGNVVIDIDGQMEKLMVASKAINTHLHGIDVDSADIDAIEIYFLDNGPFMLEINGNTVIDIGCHEAYDNPSPDLQVTQVSDHQ